jgi:hypothetical protein
MSDERSMSGSGKPNGSGRPSGSNNPSGGADSGARQLAEDIRGEFGQMEIVVEELDAIADDVADGPVTLRDRAAASAFLASLYMGVENVLKRIARFHGVELPQGERWHVELFERFCAPEAGSLPVLFEGDLIRQMDAYRRFRHVIHHGYERDLDYEKMRPGVEGAQGALEAFREEVEKHLDDISP